MPDSDDSSPSSSASLDDPALRALAAEVAAALGRCQRASSFYDATHPASQEHRRDLEEAIDRWQRAARGDVVLGATGDRLLATGAAEEGLADDTARELSSALVSRSVVGLKFLAPPVARELDGFLGCLVESADRLRAAGGIAKVLTERGVRTVQVSEIDFDRLHAGDAVDHSTLHPIVAKALAAALILRGSASPRGTAISVALSQVTTPSSLGSLLDELIDGAAPGVALGPPVKPVIASNLAGASAAELAELGAQGFGKLSGQGSNNPEVLAEAARVLSAALVRLAPHARFKLLQRLADQSDDAGAGALARAVPNPILLSAISQVVMGGGRDSKLASAIGNLLERLRPLEQDRHQLIQELDVVASQRGRPLEGLFLQELGELSNRKSLGPLELPFRATRDRLVQAARLRQAAGGQHEIVQRTFASLAPENRVQRTVRLYCAVLQGEHAMGADMLAAIRALFTTPARDPVFANAGGDLILALWERAILDGPASPAAAQLLEVVASPTGPDWCIGLLRQLRGRLGADLAMLLAEVVRVALDAHQSESFRKRLVEALDEIDPTVLRVLERRIGKLSPAGVSVLIARAGRHSPTAALSLAQGAFRDATGAVRQALLRSLAQFPIAQVLAFLSRAAGLEGDQAARAALGAQQENFEALFALQCAAVEALGGTKAPAAVASLATLLNRVGEPGVQRMCVFAARALTINNTAEAYAALEQGKRSKHRVVRLACGATT